MTAVNSKFCLRLLGNYDIPIVDSEIKYCRQSNINPICSWSSLEVTYGIAWEEDASRMQAYIDWTSDKRDDPSTEHFLTTHHLVYEP